MFVLGVITSIFFKLSRALSGDCMRVCGCYSVSFSCFPSSIIRFRSSNLCCISNSLVKHQQKPDIKTKVS